MALRLLYKDKRTDVREASVHGPKKGPNDKNATKNAELKWIKNYSFITVVQFWNVWNIAKSQNRVCSVRIIHNTRYENTISIKFQIFFPNSGADFARRFHFQ